MAYSPMKGMLYGSRSSSLIENAMKQQATSAMVQKLYAGSKLYTPSMFGGDANIAVTAYEKAIDIYEQGEVVNNWMYLDSMVGLSMAYKKTEKSDLAKETLGKAIELEPDYYWAKSILASLK
jgi:Tfp pilus assembly protein PilF